MNPEALILRRCYPVPVTFADLRRAYDSAPPSTRAWLGFGAYLAKYAGGINIRTLWTSAIKEATGALDEVYAVVDGREVRVATTDGEDVHWIGQNPGTLIIGDLLDAADRAGYWASPHEVRLPLEERAITHDEVARAVLVGQAYVEGKAVRS